MDTMTAALSVLARLCWIYVRGYVAYHLSGVAGFFYDPAPGSIHESIAVFLCITAVILAVVDFMAMMMKSETINHLAISVGCAILGFSQSFLGYRFIPGVNEFREDLLQGAAYIVQDMLDAVGLEMHPIMAYIPGFVGMLIGACLLYIISSRTVVKIIKRRLDIWFVDSPPSTEADVIPSRRKPVVQVQDRTTTRLETSRQRY